MTISKGWRRKRVRVCACVGDALPLSCLHVAKNVVALRLKIVLHEGLLAAAVAENDPLRASRLLVRLSCRRRCTRGMKGGR